MDIRQIRYFNEVVRQGSISRAAKTLGMTQPPLSTTIANLEKELGVRLLERTGRGVRPTPAGELLVRRGDALLRETETLTRELQRHGQGVSGSLTLAAVIPFAWAYLPTVLARYHDTAPYVDISLSDPTPDLVIDGLMAGSIDVAIMATSNPERMRTMYQGTFRIERLTTLPLVAVLPVSLADAPDPLPLADLVQGNLLLPHTTPRFPGLTELVVDECLAQGMAPPRIQGVLNLQTTLPLISAGMGVSVMPPEIRQLAQTAVVTKEIDPVLPRLQVEVVWNQAARPNEVVTLFLETVLRRAVP
ncbi:LysR family transcriptional regulator [Georgenia sp. SYP-B2076]|uniref:LysR family transcriptional regulator n=1 Tax=Georgenia sp. SYP-B2076 TaxID=2495881 RepID=UPI000F8CB3B7|nr:LysR family transcriptional regulator [Georgenia sp. SYP-B2076]